MLRVFLLAGLAASGACLPQGGVLRGTPAKAALIQRGKDPSLADQELERIQTEEEIGHSLDTDGSEQNVEEQDQSQDDAQDEEPTPDAETFEMQWQEERQNG